MVYFLNLNLNFVVDTWRTPHRSQIEDVVPLTDGSSRCILGSIFVNVGLVYIARQMGTQKWGICRTSSITEVVMQMKYTMGKGKNATVKTWGNEPKWENSRWPPLTQ